MLTKLPNLTTTVIKSIQQNKSTNTKLFINDTSDKRITKILCQNGWKQIPNNQISTSIYNLKWTWKVNQKDYENLQPNQLINHYKYSEQLTTKMGLMNNLRRNGMISDIGTNYSSFYPRTYNLHTQQQQFKCDFIETGILNFFKKLVVSLQIYHNQQYTNLIQLSKQITITNTGSYLQSLINKHRIFSTTKKNRNNNLLRVDGHNYINLLVFLENKLSLDSCYKLSKQEQIRLLHADIISNDQQQQQQQQQQKYSNNNNNNNKQQQLQYPSKKSLILLLHYYKQLIASSSNNNNIFESDGFSNIWIIKSNHGSRGRTIQLINQYQQIQLYSNGMKIVQKYVENIWVLHRYRYQQYKQALQKQQQILKLQQLNKKRNKRYTLQQQYKQQQQQQQQQQQYKQQQYNNKYEYIQRIIQKKFDIRIWVLVKSFSPLCIYVYQQGYLRISSSNYQLTSLKSKKSHLTNYSINWNNNNKNIKVNNNKNIKLDNKQQQSYLLLSEFTSFLQSYNNNSNSTNNNNNDSILNNKINMIIIQTLKSIDCTNMDNNNINNNNNSNCFELYGFDFLLDAQLSPWLLQCNMSPACHQRGKLSQIYQQMISGMFSIMGIIQSTQIYQWNNIYNQNDYYSNINNNNINNNNNTAIITTQKTISHKNTNKINNTNNNKTYSINISNISNNSNRTSLCTTKQSFFKTNHNNKLNRFITMGTKITNIKQYFIFERYQYYLDNVIKIQRFIRQKYHMQAYQKYKIDENRVSTDGTTNYSSQSIKDINVYVDVRMQRKQRNQRNQRDKNYKNKRETLKNNSKSKLNLIYKKNNNKYRLSKLPNKLDHNKLDHKSKIKRIQSL